MSGSHGIGSHQQRKWWSPIRDFYQAHKVVSVVLGTVVAILTALVINATYDFLVKPAYQGFADGAQGRPVDVAVSNNGSGDPRAAGAIGWASPDALDLPTGFDAPFAPPEGAAVVAIARPVSGENFPFVGSTSVSFSLTGTRYERARITKIEAVIDQRNPPPAGTVMYQVPQGDSPNGRFAVDLDSPDLNAKSITENGVLLGSNYVDDRTVSINKDEAPFGFVARVTATDCDCAYHFKLSFNTGDSVDVTDVGGKSFHLVTFGKSYQRAYTTEYDERSNVGVFSCEFLEGCKASYASFHR